MRTTRRHAHRFIEYLLDYVNLKGGVKLAKLRVLTREELEKTLQERYEVFQLDNR